MENLTTAESFKIIQSVIELRKRKYEQSGFFLLFWGILVAVAGVGQFIIIKAGMPEKSGIIWLVTMIPGFIFTSVSGYLKAKKKSKQQKSSDTMGWLWFFSGLLAMLNGFIFGKYLGTAFIFALFLPFVIAGMASAISIKNKIWIIASVLATLLAYCSIFVPYIYHPLVSALMAILLFVVPGINLHINYKRNKHV